jgi:hypothetical protein
MESLAGKASPEKLRVCDLIPIVEFYAQNIED